MMRLITALLLVLSTTSTAARADFNDGVVALTMGNYDQALETLMPLANTANHAYAQYFLGRMYAAGQGVEQDPAEAAKWYQKAAEQGVAEAQFRLGGLYQHGDGVPQDMEYAYAWYSVATHLGHAKATGAFAESKDQLTAEEFAEAQKLSQDLINRYGHVPKTTSRMD